MHALRTYVGTYSNYKARYQQWRGQGTPENFCCPVFLFIAMQTGNFVHLNVTTEQDQAQQDLSCAANGLATVPADCTSPGFV